MPADQPLLWRDSRPVSIFCQLKERADPHLYADTDGGLERETGSANGRPSGRTRDPLLAWQMAYPTDVR